MRSPPAPAADGFIEVEGARLRHRDEGAGFPLLLVHGWALDLDMWAPQSAALSKRLRVIRFDRRGFGESSGSPSLDADVHDIETLLHRLNVPRVAILGMSQGARAALRVAAGPLRGRVTCLILDGAPFASAEDEPELPLERYRELARTRGLEALRAELRRHPFAKLRTRDPSARALLEQITARYPAQDLLTADGTVAAAAPALHTIDVPVLVLNGALDTARRRSMGNELCRLLPRAERALVPAAGHLPNLDDPATYNRLVLAFVERHAVNP
jgi:pimeloyl-ACP methyl ester carboxylesterase